MNETKYNYFTMNIFVLTMMLMSLCLCACEKDGETKGDPSQTLDYQSLVADKDTIYAGETTGIVATSTGYNVTYFWSASAGDILGSGPEVMYTSSPCYIGKNKVTCKVKDGNNQSSTKSIYIVVQ